MLMLCVMMARQLYTWVYALLLKHFFFFFINIKKIDFIHTVSMIDKIEEIDFNFENLFNIGNIDLTGWASSHKCTFWRIFHEFF